ncbi:MAG: DUF1801 domain-containing protein [Bradyrhizobium sp.]|uniref:DUF1801 domain-containing protein n=1 Tax=Bradyrhizobium sp. TaxID=376 RepID=UPI0025BAAF14|nr:DUF1801 domain-containing protein [Bradyrhizobium sp.]MBI5263152.1 DUF1801 domain-containing protein [Bradyrhizobium sp.]
MADDFLQFMEKRVQEKHRPIIDAFRTLMRRMAPEAEERMRGGTEAYYSVPVYRVKRDIVAISPNKGGVTFSFTKGAAFDDPFKLLGGTGKTSRNVLVRSMDDFHEKALTHYIRQAVKLDGQ